MPDQDGKYWWIERLKGSGYRLSSSREHILEVLQATDDHLSAEDIYLRVHALYPAVGLASVYRTLELLARIGMVYKFDFGHGKAQYELAEDVRGKKHHHHLVCTGCKKVIDYKDFGPEEMEFLKRAEEGLYKRYDFKITNHLIQFYGTCAACNKR